MDDLSGAVWCTGHLERVTRRAKGALVDAVSVQRDIYLAVSRFKVSETRAILRARARICACE